MSGAAALAFPPDDRTLAAAARVRQLFGFPQLLDPVTLLHQRVTGTTCKVLAPDGTPFGARLRALVQAERPGGIVVLGSGGLALASERDLRLFVEAAADGRRVALANNRYSADAIAVSCAESLLTLPDLPSDNPLPRWMPGTTSLPLRVLPETAYVQATLARLPLRSRLRRLVVSRLAGRAFAAANRRDFDVQLLSIDPGVESAETVE